MMILSGLLALAPSAHAGGLAGVDWRPFSRADAAWVVSGQGSGTGKAEQDGTLQPSLTAWGGPTSGNHAFLFSLAVAWERTASWTGTREQSETERRSLLQGSIRPGFDWRVHLRPVDEAGIVPWVSVGAYGVIPMAQYRDEAFSEAEQAAWNEAAREDRARIAGAGSRAGAGIEHRWDSGLALGARHLLVLHRAQEVDEDTYAATTTLQTDTALFLAFSF